MAFSPAYSINYNVTGGGVVGTLNSHADTRALMCAGTSKSNSRTGVTLTLPLPLQIRLFFH